MGEFGTKAEAGKNCGRDGKAIRTDVDVCGTERYLDDEKTGVETCQAGGGPHTECGGYGRVGRCVRERRATEGCSVGEWAGLAWEREREDGDGHTCGVDDVLRGRGEGRKNTEVGSGDGRCGGVVRCGLAGSRQKRG